MSKYKLNYADIRWGAHIIAPKNYAAPSPHRSDFPTPQVSGDFAAYDCPITGKSIEGRVAHEENLRRHDCRILETGEKEDNSRNAAAFVESENVKRDAVIDGIVDQVAKDIL
jgi:hypothetical protein